MSGKRTWALALCVGLVSPGAGHAQTRPSPAPPVFGTAITVVTLPVFVTDKDGAPVSGLTAADFEVTDEGRPARIVGLQEIDVAKPLPSIPGREAIAARREFLVLFDMSFTSPSGIVRSRDAAASFVRNLAPSDLAAVATLSVRSGLKLLVGFTSDRGQLEAAVRTLGSRDLDRKTDPLALVYDFAPIGESSGVEGGKAIKEEAIREELRQNQILFRRHDQASYKRDVGGLLKSLGQLARTLDAVQGRKQILYLSAGFDQTALIGEQGEAAKSSGEAVVEGRLWEVDSESRFGDTGIRSQMQEMLRLFTGADVVVHAIDVTGLAARGDAASAEGGEVLGTGRESLNQIADGTGGRFVKDANDLTKALGEILDSTRQFYVMAVEPASPKGPGKFHKLKVKVRARNASVSHRSGYYESSPELARNPLAGRLEAAEAVVKGLSGGEIETRLLAFPYRNTEGRLSLPVVLEVDGTTLLARGSGSNLALEIYGYAVAEDGSIADAVSLAPTLQLDKIGPRIAESGLQLQATFTLRPGKHTLRFLVRDAEKRRRGVRSLDVTVPSFEAGAMLLYPPLFMDDPARRLVLQAASRAGGATEMPFHVGTDPFTPRGRPRLANGRTDSVCVMAYDGGAKYDPGTQFEIKAQLLDNVGTPVKMGRLQLTKAVAETDGFRRFVLNVTPAEVPPGDYSFKVKVRDPASGNVSEAAQDVRVE